MEFPQFSDKFMEEVNKIANEVLNEGVKSKGTSYYYTEGSVGNKKVQFTKAKTGYKNRFGFWSWIATSYKTGKTKRTRFAMSGSRANAQKRAKQLLKQLEEKNDRKLN